MPSPVSAQEFARLSALFRYGVLDTNAEPALDLIVTQLARHCAAPLVQLAFADAYRLWTKAAVGPIAVESPRVGSLADLLIAERPLLNIRDVLDDPICHAGVLVGEPSIRAFAGVRLQSGEEDAVGVLCIADAMPRVFSGPEIAAVEEAARNVMALMESHRRGRVDPDTGALTRDAFAEQTRRILEITRSTGQGLSIAVLDVSRFQTRLEDMKPGLGQIALRRMADLGRDQVRRRDSFGRLGDATFGVLLTDTDDKGATILARRLSENLGRGWSALVPAVDMEPIAVGIASMRPGLDDGPSLLAAAERACQASARPDRQAMVA